jgi:transcriptional antiterminator RfaH
MAAKAWYVIHTKPHKEASVHSYLESQDLETFFPHIEVIPTNPRSSTIRPYFPGYLFMRADLETTGMGLFRWMPGAVGLVEFGGQPARVPDAVINQLKTQLRNIQIGENEKQDALKPGDRVRVTSGPLEGFEGIFDSRLSGRQRVSLLLDMVGRLVKVEINADAIESRRSH